jgi:hypothetical protein
MDLDCPITGFLARGQQVGSWPTQVPHLAGFDFAHVVGTEGPAVAAPANVVPVFVRVVTVDYI